MVRYYGTVLVDGLAAHINGSSNYGKPDYRRKRVFPCCL